MFRQMFWIVEFTRQNSRNTSAFFFSSHPFIFRITLTFYSMFETSLVFVIVEMLSHYLLLTGVLKISKHDVKQM